MKSQGTLRVALAFAALLGSLSLVIWRQSRTLDVLAGLDRTRVRRAVVESERSRAVERIQYLESRARIAEVAASWWGMRVPSADEEFVIILRPGAPSAPPAGPARIASSSIAAAGAAETGR